MSGPEENKDLENETENSEPIEATEETASESDSETASETASESVSESTSESKVTADGNDELNLGQEQVLEFVSYVVVNLVDHPDDVTVDIVRRQGRDIYQVRVNQEDLGKVIGKGGQTARALRVMLTALSARTDQRVGLEIVE